MSALRCGCVPGRRPCAEAERLWETVADAHHDWTKAGDGNFKDSIWLIFQIRLDAYNEHLEEPAAEAGEQIALGGSL